MDIIPNFVVFEGGDGSGTTTQIKLLASRLRDKIPKLPFYHSFEPTDGKIGQIINFALKKELKLKPETLAMLFAADRNEHLNAPGGIIERANRGQLVVSDRYALSSLVYQGIECGDELAGSLNSRFPAPEITIFFDVDHKIALNRVHKRASLEIYEYREFQEKVREKYQAILDIYRDSGARVETVDASKSAQEVAEQVWDILSQMPIIKANEGSP